MVLTEAARYELRALDPSGGYFRHGIYLLDQVLDIECNQPLDT